ncbi:MAG: response regulator [Sedimentisphaerales bacterium]|nr:response regulator [Sedimentisphaerales bacterium]
MSLNILIVDDSSLTRKAIRRIIDMLSLGVGEVLEAENGSEALKVLDEANINLVLADLNMPEMTGIEMIYRMKDKATTKDIPVVLVTTESSTTRIDGLLANGAKAYLHKPFTPEEFKKVITQAVGVPSHD